MVFKCLQKHWYNFAPLIQSSCCDSGHESVERKNTRGGSTKTESYSLEQNTLYMNKISAVPFRQFDRNYHVQFLNIFIYNFTATKLQKPNTL